MTVIDLATWRAGRAQAPREGVKRIGRTTEIVDPQSYVTCVCGFCFKGRSVITRDADGFIGMCPNCLDNASKGELSKGARMSDTGDNDDNMPFQLTAVVRAKTPEAIGDALAALHGLARDKHVTLTQRTPIVRRDFSISVECKKPSAPPGEDQGEAPKPVRET